MGPECPARFPKIIRQGQVRDEDTKAVQRLYTVRLYMYSLYIPYCDNLSYMLIHTLSTHRPLFKQCKRKEVEPDILLALFEMVKECESGDFMKANDHYLRCAIGTC